MRKLRAWLLRFKGFFHKADRERDFADELKSHLQMHIDDNIRAGAVQDLRFATVALLLGVVGLYGVIAYSVSQRTREIGVRITLGAQRGTVYRLILKEASVLALAGIVIGTACAILASCCLALRRGILQRLFAWLLCWVHRRYSRVFFPPAARRLSIRFPRFVLNKAMRNVL